jgi:hypothetical protein
MNSYDSVASMGPEYAISLYNWFPDGSILRLRNGEKLFATVPGPNTGVRSLFEYTPAAGTSKFYAQGYQPGVASTLYDITSGAPVSTGVTFNAGTILDTVNFGNGTSSWLIVAPNDSAYKYYDGTTWSTYAGGGFLASGASFVNLFKQMLFFGKPNSLAVVYFAPNAVTGTVSATNTLDFSGLCVRGGSLIKMLTWTTDGGEGGEMTDMAVFFTSKGEILMFNGSNPAYMDSWDFVGRYQIDAPPLNAKCIIRYGSDVLMLLENGLYSLRDVMKPAIDQPLVAVSRNVQPTLLASVRKYLGDPSWQVMHYPRGHMILVNNPDFGSQFVMNTMNKAWTIYNGNWIPFAFALFGGVMYSCGGDNNLKVIQHDTGCVQQDGFPIFGQMQQAYSTLGAAGYQKHVTLLKAQLASRGEVIPGLALSTDYSIGINAGDGVWSFVPNVSDPNKHVTQRWQQYGVIGDAVAISMMTSVGDLGGGVTADSDVQYFGTVMLVKQGGPV